MTSNLPFLQGHDLDECDPVVIYIQKLEGASQTCSSYITFIQKKKRVMAMAASLFMPSSVSSIIYPLFLLFAFFSVYWLSSFLEFHMCAIASLMQIN